MVPVRNVKWETSEEGHVVLLRPKYRNGILARILLPRMKNPYFKIKLDEIGTAVWLLCDGESCVADIAENLKEEFGDKIEPCVGRLELFLAHLEGSGYLEFTNVEECRKNQQARE